MGSQADEGTQADEGSRVTGESRPVCVCVCAEVYIAWMYNCEDDDRCAGNRTSDEW